MSVSYKIRKANINDTNDVFKLSNSDEVRLNSLNNGYIDWEEHKKWFEEKIQSKDILFLIVEDENGKFSGQIRFEFNQENNEVRVSISLNQNLKGKGLAKKILAEAMEHCSNEIDFEVIFIAEILEKNIASIKLFKRLGFVINRKRNSVLYLSKKMEGN